MEPEPHRPVILPSGNSQRLLRPAVAAADLPRDLRWPSERVDLLTHIYSCASIPRWRHLRRLQPLLPLDLLPPPSLLQRPRIHPLHRDFRLWCQNESLLLPQLFLVGEVSHLQHHV